MADTQLPAEVWVDIPGYEGHYQVSNLSRIRSLDKLVNGGRSGVKLKKSKVLTHANRHGYRCVTLSKHGMSKTNLVHRVVASVFIPNLDNKPFINHINGIKHDNRIENLEWCTGKENSDHKFNVLGYKQSKETNKKIQVYVQQRAIKLRKPVKCIEDDLLFESVEETAKHYGVTRRAIRNLIQKKSYSRKGKSFIYA